MQITMEKPSTQTLFKDFEKHLLEDEKPSLYFEKLASETDIFEKMYPFTMLGELTPTQQSPLHHPEGSVWNHTMMVTDMAATQKHLSEDPKALMWAALLHDLGKASTTRVKGEKITAYDHDRVGARLAEKFLKEYTEDNVFIEKVTKLVRWHMQILYVLRNLPFADLKHMTEEVTIEEIALLSMCDRLGRGAMTEEKRKLEEENVKNFMERCRDYMDSRALEGKMRFRKIEDEK